MFPHQLTPEVMLDFFSTSDAPALFALIDKNRDYLKTFLPWLDYSQQESDSDAFIQKVNLENQEKIALTLAIKRNEAIIGVICFHPFDKIDNSGGIGYWLDAAHQGQGIITLACETLIAYGFQDLDLAEIRISCASHNHKSQAIPQRLGFSRKEFIPQKEWLYDRYVDHCCYLMSKEEWESLKEPHLLRI
jgi:ribosomal-protein-serine acetyltransferase